MSKIKVLIVDDSAVVRQVLTEILSKDPQIEIVGSASDPIFAQRYLEKEWPDVIILDLEMPRMDGITFLKKIMSERPTPVVICSSLSKEGAAVTMEAVSAGAVEIITKPELGLKGFLEDSAVKFIHSVKGAAAARVGKLTSINTPPKNFRTPDTNLIKGVPPKLSADVVISSPGGSSPLGETTDKVVAIGASTGGTQSLEIVLRSLQLDCHGVVIVQHMPENFTAAFAQRLDSVCKIHVKEGEDGDRIIRGQAIVAPGNKHLAIKRSGAQYRVQIMDGPLVSRHRPSVDVLFRSAAKEAGKNAMGVIMTGMGDDGAAGMLEMFNAGSLTYAQDEDTCIVYGMPAEAVKRGAAKEVISLYQIAGKITAFR